MDRSWQRALRRTTAVERLITRVTLEEMLWLSTLWCGVLLFAMGCCSCCGRVLVVDSNIMGRNQASIDFLKRFFEDSELIKLYRAFCEADLNSKNSIRYDEFFGYYHIEASVVNKRIFRFLDERLEYMNFLDYSITMWNFLSTVNPA